MKIQYIVGVMTISIIMIRVTLSIQAALNYRTIAYTLEDFMTSTMVETTLNFH